MMFDKEIGRALGNARYGTLDNSMCPVCRKEQGLKLEQHLKSEHGMNDQDASVVAKDNE